MRELAMVLLINSTLYANAHAHNLTYYTLYKHYLELKEILLVGAVHKERIDMDIVWLEMNNKISFMNQSHLKKQLKWFRIGLFQLVKDMYFYNMINKIQSINILPKFQSNHILSIDDTSTSDILTSNVKRPIEGGILLINDDINLDCIDQHIIPYRELSPMIIWDYVSMQMPILEQKNSCPNSSPLTKRKMIVKWNKNVSNYAMFKIKLYRNVDYNYIGLILHFFPFVPLEI
ncbi:hypothetical protein ACJX0J_029031 [Zea mays]